MKDEEMQLHIKKHRQDTSESIKNFLNSHHLNDISSMCFIFKKENGNIDCLAFGRPYDLMAMHTVGQNMHANQLINAQKVEVK